MACSNPVAEPCGKSVQRGRLPPAKPPQSWRHLVIAPRRALIELFVVLAETLPSSVGSGEDAVFSNLVQSGSERAFLRGFVRHCCTISMTRHLLLV